MSSAVELIDQQYLKAKAGRSLYYDYISTRQFCQEIGLIWLGDKFVEGSDKDAWLHAFSQEQVDIAMRHHLWQVESLFSPGRYCWKNRLLMAFYFITGWKPK